MSQGALWNQVRMAWAILAGRREHQVEPGRSRESPPRPTGDEPALATSGFTEEALPWLDAVHRFSLRLTRGDIDAAEDLTQETFLRAHRFWHTFTRGTNAKSWLFTICRRQFLAQRRSPRVRELAASDVAENLDELAESSAFAAPAVSPEAEFFDRFLDDQVVAAIDALPKAFRDVLTLSDLGDLQYREIAEVLEIPVGTVRSRLFRARHLLQGQLRAYAVDAGYIHASQAKGTSP